MGKQESALSCKIVSKELMIIPQSEEVLECEVVPPLDSPFYACINCRCSFEDDVQDTLLYTAQFLGTLIK